MGNKITHNKRSNFTIIDNNIVRNKELTLKGKGMMLVLLSLPDGWEFTEMGLVAILKEGRDAVRATLQELEKFGYLHRKRLRDDKGKMAGTEYIVNEIPVLDNPTYEKPIYENTTQLNKEELNKEELNNSNNNNDKETEIFNLYQQEIGIPSQMIIERVKYWVDEYDIDWIKKAIEVSVMNNKRNASYIEGILKRWVRDGITLEKPEKKSYYKPKQKDNSNMPDWFDKEIMKKEPTKEELSEIKKLFGRE